MALPLRLLAQGETTSAIVGQVNDPTSAAVPGATVTITNQETGLKRIAKTDDAGQFNFPQLKPGTYSVRWTPTGSPRSENDNVFVRAGPETNGQFHAQTGALGAEH